MPAAAVSEIYATGETHQAGLAAVERTTKALAAAAAQQLPTETIIDTWKANRSDPGGIAAALDAVTAAVRAATEADPGDPPPLPSLEERYRERFPTNAGDVDGPRWSPAKELMEEHQALQGLGRRSKLDREYHDCFQRLDSSLFTHHRWPVKDDPSLPHCLLDTHDSPPANEAADPLRAIDQYERSLPTAYGSDWRELDIPGRARKAVEKVVNSVATTSERRSKSRKRKRLRSARSARPTPERSTRRCSRTAGPATHARYRRPDPRAAILGTGAGPPRRAGRPLPSAIRSPAHPPP